MGTIVGTGASTKATLAMAVDEATRMALGPLNKRTPQFGFVFTGPDRDLGAALTAVKRTAGQPTVIGATTAGEFTAAGLTHGGVTVMLVASDATSSRAGFAKDLKEDYRGAATRLARGLAEARQEGFGKNQRRPTTVLLTDGLAGKGEDLVLDLSERMSAAQIVGGAAGDEGEFRETRVGCDGDSASDAVAALHVLSEKPWGVGVGHGLRPTTKPMRVTKAADNVVLQVNGAPAFDIYRAHAAQRGVKLTPANASPYMIANELGIHFFDRVTRARAPLSVGDDGSLNCAAAIPEGAMVSILDGDPDSMVAAASSAAEEARDHLEGSKAAGVLLFDCVCRGMILKDGFQREIAAVRKVFGEVPVAGFLTYGEIARYTGRLEGWHNSTAVVVALPE
jgi:methyl-accepting chemotaxis protein